MSYEFLFRLNKSFLHTCKSNCVYSACVRASTQCQFPNSEGSRREDLMKREIQIDCFFLCDVLDRIFGQCAGNVAGPCAHDKHDP